jgi:hypothetical protein
MRVAFSATFKIERQVSKNIRRVYFLSVISILQATLSVYKLVSIEKRQFQLTTKAK